MWNCSNISHGSMGGAVRADRDVFGVCADGIFVFFGKGGQGGSMAVCGFHHQLWLYPPVSLYADASGNINLCGSGHAISQENLYRSRYIGDGGFLVCD